MTPVIAILRVAESSSKGMDTWMLQCLLAIKGDVVLTGVEVTIWKRAVIAFDLTERKIII